MQRVLEQFSRGKNWWENCPGLVQQQAPAHYWSHEVDVFRCHCYRLSKVCSVTDTLKKLFFCFFFPRFGMVCVATRLYRPWLNSAINDWKFCGLLIIHWTLAIINDQSTDYSLITHWFHWCHRLALSGNKDALK